MITCFVACQKTVKPKLKLATASQVPFARQLSTPVARSDAYQTQLAQNRTDYINGDVGLNPASSVSLISAAYGALQVKPSCCITHKLILS